MNAKRILVLLFCYIFPLHAGQMLYVFNETDHALFMALYEVRDSDKHQAKMSISPADSQYICRYVPPHAVSGIEKPDAMSDFVYYALAVSKTLNDLPYTLTYDAAKSLPSYDVLHDLLVERLYASDAPGGTLVLSKTQGIVTKNTTSGVSAPVTAEAKLASAPIKESASIKSSQAPITSLAAPIQTRSVALDTFLTPAVRSDLMHNLVAFTKNPHENQAAQVRFGTEISSAEQQDVMRRQEKVKQSLTKVLPVSLIGKKTPTVALIAGGPGFHSLACFAGTLMGLQGAELLDTITYCVTSGGASWAQALWQQQQWALPAYKKKIFSITQQGIQGVTTHQATALLQAFAVKAACNQPLTVIDFFGGAVGNVLFNDTPLAGQLVYLSAQAGNRANGIKPFPIYAAAVKTPEPVLLAYTPHEVGSSALGFWVPTWAFGRKFAKGESDAALACPEQPLSFLLGAWATDSSATFVERYKDMKALLEPGVPLATMPGVDMLEGIKALTGAMENPMTLMAQVFNPVYQTNSTLASKEMLSIGDYQEIAPLPYGPVSGEQKDRIADVVIVCDYSDDAAKNIKAVEQEVRQKGYKFPIIDYDKLERDKVAIFKDAVDKSVPVICCITIAKDEGLINRLLGNQILGVLAKKAQHFDLPAYMQVVYKPNIYQFSPDQANDIMFYVEFVIRAHKQEIIATLAEALRN